MPRTRIKICGITCPEDALAAAHAGADAIGLVFFSGSSRNVNPVIARQIVAALPPFVTVVGLFVNADPEHVQYVLQQMPLHLLQFHGNEEPDYCAAFGFPYIKAVPMGAGADVTDYAQRFEAADGLLLDNYGGDQIGGSGQRFDWARIPPQVAKPIILAGGLNPTNVSAAVQQIRPFAVDVSSGVEIAKGIKDSQLIRAFVGAVEKGEHCV
ncbi:MAG: phosphoribosylanthranilate isomerase [Candidatus Competibacteraceae bacterium]|jgi:phosphoribosylanthranilate isomerase|nr:phosphoribosylanthranilate isomerase [Candidatus Competibacteraceae bacterium]